MHNFKDLKIWQKAMELTKEVYLISKEFPPEEVFGLTAQLKKAAVSIPSNIAEGAGRSSNKDFNRFLDITNGSINEVETQILLAQSLAFISDETVVEPLCKELDILQKMIFNLQKTLSIS